MKDWQVLAIIAVALVAVVGLLMFQPDMWNIMGRADISAVMEPYEMLFDNVDQTCATLGGEWHDEANFWGCEGAGPDDCHNELADIIEMQCEGMGATWVCDSGDVYCRY